MPKLNISLPKEAPPPPQRAEVGVFHDVGTRQSRQPIKSLRPQIERPYNKQVLGKMATAIEKRFQESGEFSQEARWIMNLNDIATGKAKWDDNPAAATAYTLHFLGVASGEIAPPPGFNSNEISSLLGDASPAVRINLSRILQNDSPVEKLEPQDIANMGQEVLKKEFRIAQAAIVPQQHTSLLEPGGLVEQQIYNKAVDYLVEHGPGYNQLGIPNLKAEVSKFILNNSPIKNKERAKYDLNDPYQFRKFVAEVERANVEAIYKQQSETLTHSPALEKLPPHIQNLIKEEGRLEKLTTSFFSQQSEVQNWTPENIFNSIRHSIDPSLTSEDYPDQDIILDLATYDFVFKGWLVDSLRGNDSTLPSKPTSEQIKSSLAENRPPAWMSSDVLTTLQGGPWYLRGDLTFAFLERKIESVQQLEGLELSPEKLNSEFFKNLKASHIAPVLAGGLLTEDQFLEKGATKQEIATAKKKYLSFNEEEEAYEMKIVDSQEIWQPETDRLADPATHHDEAVETTIKNIDTQDLRVISLYTALVIDHFEEPGVAESLYRAHKAKYPDDDRDANQITKYLIAQQVKRLIDDNGNPLPLNKNEYNRIMKLAKQTVAETYEQEAVEKIQQELAQQKTQEYKNRHMTETVAKEINPIFYAALEKMDKLSPEVLQNASREDGDALKNAVEALTKSPDNTLNPDRFNAIIDDPGSSPNRKFSPVDWTVLLMMLQSVGPAILNNLTEEQKQQMQNFIS